MPVRRKLSDRARRGDRIDAGVPGKTPVLGGDQHPAIEGVDHIGLDRQPPLSVPGQEAAQDRPIARDNKDRGAAAAVQRRRWEHEISGRRDNHGEENRGRRNRPAAG